MLTSKKNQDQIKVCSGIYSITVYHKNELKGNKLNYRSFLTIT